VPSPSELLALIPALYLLAVAWPLAVIDLREHRLPNRLVLPAYPIALVFQLVATIISMDWARFLVSVLCSLVVLVIGILANYFDVLGMGDVKLAGALALILGYFNLYLPMVAIGIAFVLAFGVIILLLFKGKVSLGTSIPLGPYLLLSFIGTCSYWLVTHSA
jgi:leader peptidase (prepilin peptidase)/N-methyltransferase